MSEGIRRFLSAESDEIDAALLVAALIDPEADLNPTRRELQALGEAYAARTGLPAAATVCEFLRTEGFAGATNYYELDNSRLDRVIARRRGIPITLAVVHLAVARAAGLAAHGINFPGHFLVSLGDEPVDPFALRVLDRDERAERERSHPFERATPRAIALRMLNNVRGILATKGDFTGVLRLLDHQLALAPSAELHLARAQVWQQLGSVDAARAALEEARRFADETLAARIDAVLANLGPSRGEVH